jgi:hypothetical protein
METAACVGDGIDHLVPNAGVYHGTPGETPLPSDSYATFDDTLRTNIRGVFAAVREAGPHLNGDARVLIPTESVARDPAPGLGSYAVSKAGAEAVMRGSPSTPTNPWPVSIPAGSRPTSPGRAGATPSTSRRCSSGPHGSRPTT